MRYFNCPRSKWKKIEAVDKDFRFVITDYELSLKYQQANDIMHTPLNKSIDSITMDAENGNDDSVSSTETDELGPTRELKIGDKVEVY